MAAAAALPSTSRYTALPTAAHALPLRAQTAATPASPHSPQQRRIARRRGTAASVAASPATGAAATMSAAVALGSLQQLPDTYRGALLDQFGVLHDGQQPYPGAIEAVSQLAQRGMRLMIISNSSRREWLGLLGLRSWPLGHSRALTIWRP